MGKSRIMESRRSLEERKRVRDQLRHENSSLKTSFERHNEEIKVHCSTACGLQYLVGRTFESERRREDVHVGTIGASHDKEYIARMIKIRTYYEAKIKEELAKVR